MGIFREYSVSNKTKNPPLKCIRGISIYAATQFHQCGMTTVTCYTSCNMNLENRNITFCSTCIFRDDDDWYDWCLVEWIDDNEERNTYLGKILGFFTMEGSVYAVHQSSSNPISMEQLTDEFIWSFVIKDHQPTEVVEVETISSTLCVFKNYEGPSHSYFCALPQRKWGHYFGQKILDINWLVMAFIKNDRWQIYHHLHSSVNHLRSCESLVFKLLLVCILINTEWSLVPLLH